MAKITFAVWFLLGIVKSSDAQVGDRCKTEWCPADPGGGKTCVFCDSSSGYGSGCGWVSVEAGEKCCADGSGTPHSYYPAKGETCCDVRGYWNLCSNHTVCCTSQTAYNVQCCPTGSTCKPNDSFEHRDMCIPPPPPPSPMKAWPLRVATYNLYWWCTTDTRGSCPQFADDKGFNQLAARVKQHGPFDIIGMQECEDVNKIASELGWMDSHEWHQNMVGAADLGVGFNKTMFEKIGDWRTKKVAEDQYGPRYLEYIRLKHKESGGTLFLGNTHGALTDCNGAGGDQKAKAYIDAVNAYIEPGDSMIVTGDLNCINRDEEIWALNATWTLACDDKTTTQDHIYMKNTTTSVSKCDDQSRHGQSGPSDHALTWADMAMLTPIKDASEVLV